MKLRNSRLLTLIPLIVAAILTQSGCAVYMRKNRYGKVVVYATKGTALKWPFKVTFQESRPPCVLTKEKGKESYTCKVGKVELAQGQPYARYYFNCDKCTDPEIDIGSGNMYKAKIYVDNEPPLPVPDQIVGIECKADHTIGLLPPTTVPLQTNKIIVFEDRGAPWVAAWTVTPTTAGACNETTIDRDHPVCTIRATATFTYTVQDSGRNACGTATGTVIF
jgi:hypothetical protein